MFVSGCSTALAVYLNTQFCELGKHASYFRASLILNKWLNLSIYHGQSFHDDNINIINDYHPLNCRCRWIASADNRNILSEMAVISRVSAYGLLKKDNLSTYQSSSHDLSAMKQLWRQIALSFHWLPFADLVSNCHWSNNSSAMTPLTLHIHPRPLTDIMRIYSLTDISLGGGGG